MSHYYSEEQESELNLSQISDLLRGERLEFYVASGVFSKSKIDKGTKVLIDNVILNPDWTILDLGCGYGPVGISIAKSDATIKVHMTDINKRAVMLAKKNIVLNKLDKKRFRITQGNSFSPVDQKVEFDSILLNPPQTAGKKLCFDMVREAKEHLKKGGLLQLVARHNKGGASFMKLMEEVYGNAKDICKEKGYRVYVSKKQ
ncbi:MAG: class I SAM-dependent methyltransferase [Candidatus Woesearchaeota archaeon]